MQELDLPTWTSWAPLSDSTTRLTGSIAKYFVDFDAVSVVIPGATKVEQVETNAGVSDLQKVSYVIHSDLATLYREEIAKSVRGAYLVFSGSFRASDEIFFDLRIANSS